MSTWSFAKTLGNKQNLSPFLFKNFGRDYSLHTRIPTQRKPLSWTFCATLTCFSRLAQQSLRDCPPRVSVILYRRSKWHSPASVFARRSPWCNTGSCDRSCDGDSHGCVATLCRCAVGDGKALFLLPASLQRCGDEGSHANGNLTRSARKFKSWTRSKNCRDDSLHLSALRCLECLMPTLVFSRVDKSHLAHTLPTRLMKKPK